MMIQKNYNLQLQYMEPTDVTPAMTGQCSHHNKLYFNDAIISTEIKDTIAWQFMVINNTCNDNPICGSTRN